MDGMKRAVGVDLRVAQNSDQNLGSKFQNTQKSRVLSSLAATDASTTDALVSRCCEFSKAPKFFGGSDDANMRCLNG